MAIALGLALGIAASPVAGAPVPAGTSLSARVVVPTTALAAPRPGARAKLRLGATTRWSGMAQRLMVTGEHRDRRGGRWVRVQLPVRPNGTAGWVRAEDVRVVATRIRFEVHVGARRFEIWRGTRRIASWPAGVGRPGTPTPIGRFAIQDPVRTLPEWRGVYGGYTLVLTAHSPTLTSFMGAPPRVAIHGAGSGRSWRVGQASSFGCVILSEPSLAMAARYARPGTPVIVHR